MKKTSLFPMLFAGTLFLSSCGSPGSLTAGNSSLTPQTGQQVGTPDKGEALGALLGGIINGLADKKSTLSEKNIRGTWNYLGSDCVFESENFLAQAGGAMASKKIEKEMNEALAKIGIKQGACSFTFNEDHTYTAVLGGKNIRGNYTLDAKNKTIKMTYLAGLASMTPRIVLKNGKMSLLFESDKLLTVVKGIAALSNRQSLKLASSVLDKYEGLYIGMQLSR